MHRYDIEYLDRKKDMVMKYPELKKRQVIN